MADDIVRHEMVLFRPDGSAQYGMLEQAKAGGPTDFRSVLNSIAHLLGASGLRMVEFANPTNPLHWHVLFWDADGLTKGLPLNRVIIERMKEVSDDCPDIYGSAVLVRNKFWIDDEAPQASKH